MWGCRNIVIIIARCPSMPLIARYASRRARDFEAQARWLLGDALITRITDEKDGDWSGCISTRGMLARRGDFGSRAADLVAGLG
jgi:hypothetical protein